MDEIGISKSDREMLTEISKMKYWRMIRLIKLSIAVGLILSIFWFGYVNYVYANDIRTMKVEYGNDWSCYMCGYESLRTCSCIYDVTKVNETFKTNLGENNIAKCEVLEDTTSLEKLQNFTFNLD